MNLDCFCREQHHQVHAKAITDALGIKIVTRISDITKDYVLVFSFGDLRVVDEMKTKGIIFCEHGTGLYYCLAKGTKILKSDLTWDDIENLKIGDSLVGFDEESPNNRGRKYKQAIVLSNEKIIRPSYRITLQDGTTIVASEDHKFLTQNRGCWNWVTVKQLQVQGKGNRGSRMMKVFDVWKPIDNSYEAGYLAGAFDGEGCLPTNRIKKSKVVLHFSQRENNMLESVKRYLTQFGFKFTVYGNKTTDVKTIHIQDSVNGIFRFLGQMKPKRLWANYKFNEELRIRARSTVKVIKKEFLGNIELFALGTNTHTFFANGYASHNSNSHSSYAGSTSHRGNVILRLSPNKSHADKEIETLECPVEIIGVPKLDKFAKRYWNFNKEKPTVAISFHFDCFVNPETRSSFNYFKSIIPELNKQFNLLGHAHPRLMPQIKDFYIKNKVRVVDDFERVMELADVYCCDNSSTIWEWCITEKPVVLLNPPFYRKEVEHKGNPRFWRLSGIAPLCNKPEELIDCIWESVRNHQNYQPIIRQAKREVLHITDGTATQTAVDIIKKYIQ